MRPICCLLFNSGNLFSCNSFCRSLSWSNVTMFFIFTNSFAFTCPIPYIFVNIFTGLVFSFSTASNVPVFRNSSYFSKIVLPIFGKFSDFNSVAELIDVAFGDDIYFLSSFIAFIYASDLKVSPLFFIIIESSFRTFINSVILLPPNIYYIIINIGLIFNFFT